MVLRAMVVMQVCVAVYCSVLHRVAVRGSATVVMQACVIVHCSVLHCVAACCSILQRVAFRCSATIVRQMCVRMCNGGGGEVRVGKV